jgi:gliding motility-associated transport system permease protein
LSSLRNVWAIVEKEWRHYFGSPIAYVALFMWAFLFGVFYSVMFRGFVLYSMQSSAQPGMGPKLSINEILIGQVLQNMAVVSLFIAPMLTMRLMAEEKRQGTIELLATSPITTLQIVLGKFLGALGLFGIMVLTGLVNFLPLWKLASSPPEWKPVLTGVLGLLLVGAAFISLGLFLSTLTRNQIVAGILAFGLALVFWVLGWFDQPNSSWWMQIVGYLGITNHINELMKGVIELKDLVFYLSFTAFGLFLAHQSVESQRWRA